jgi:IclR family transcriptional regulator, KDG regulon repressor
MVQSVNRALDILEFFPTGSETLGITEIADLLKVSKGTAHGLVTTLVRRDFLQQDPATRRYRLGMKIFHLGLFLVQHSQLGQAIHPWADMLCERFQEVVNVALLAGDVALVIQRFEPKVPHLLFPQAGSSLPVHSTAAGKVLLAFSRGEARNHILKTTALIRKTQFTLTNRSLLNKEFQKILRQGFAVDREESLLGVVCIGAPIRDRSGEVVAAVSLSGSKTRVEAKGMKEMVEGVRSTAMKISAAMGYFEGAPARPPGFREKGNQPAHSKIPRRRK